MCDEDVLCRVVDVFLVGYLGYGIAEWLDALHDRLSSASWDLSLTLLFLWTGSPTALAMALLAVRRLARGWVLKSLLSVDATEYRDAWLSFAASAASGATEKESIITVWQESMLRVESAAAALTPRGPPIKVLQRLRSCGHHSSSLCSDNSSRNQTANGQGEWEAWPAVTSVEQLFGQASAAMVFLRHKAREWALACDGCFWVVPAVDPTAPARLRRWSDIAAEPGVWRVRWTRRKRAARALEKLQRAYGGDPARLGDVCRECIVLGGLDDVARCLDAIRADPEAHVVRVKNRLGAAGDAAWCAGYR